MPRRNIINSDGILKTPTKETYQTLARAKTTRAGGGSIEKARTQDDAYSDSAVSQQLQQQQEPFDASSLLTAQSGGTKDGGTASDNANATAVCPTSRDRVGHQGLKTDTTPSSPTVLHAYPTFDGDDVFGEGLEASPARGATLKRQHQSHEADVANNDVTDHPRKKRRSDQQQDQLVVLDEDAVNDDPAGTNATAEQHTRSLWVSLGQKEEAILSNNSAWLNDEIINTMLTTIVAPFTHCPAVTPYDAAAGSNVRIRNVIEESDGSICNLVMIQNAGGHWFTQRLQWGTGDAGANWVKMEIYDSLHGALKEPVPASRQAAELDLVAKFLPPKFEPAATAAAAAVWDV